MGLHLYSAQSASIGGRLFEANTDTVFLWLDGGKRGEGREVLSLEIPQPRNPTPALSYYITPNHTQTKKSAGSTKSRITSNTFYANKAT